MKLDDIRYQYVLLPGNKIGVEDILTGSISELAEYTLPSDILHMNLIDTYGEVGLPSLPPISAARMSALFKQNIVAIYMEII